MTHPHHETALMLLRAADFDDFDDVDTFLYAHQVLVLLCGPVEFLAMAAAVDAKMEAREKVLREEVERLRALINAPETEDWFAGVRVESAHQQERWGSQHDAGKKPLDWFWLIGYLAQKAAASAMVGEVDKAKHHTISTAAAMLNWHRALSGSHTAMRPGIDTAVLDAKEKSNVER